MSCPADDDGGADDGGDGMLLIALSFNRSVGFYAAVLLHIVRWW